MSDTSDTVQAVGEWGQSLIAPTTALWAKVVAFLPNFIGFLLILVIGYFVARLVATILKRLLILMKLDTLSDRVGISGALGNAGVTLQVSDLLSRLVFWILMLGFMISATESLGMTRLSGTIEGVVQYLPKVLGAVFILLLGLYVAQIVRDVVTNAAQGVGLDSAVALGRTAYGLIFVIVLTLAVGQLELETDILGQVISIVLISVGAAAALSFGIGSRRVAANVLAGTYVRELFQEGDELVIGDVRGTVTQVTPLKTELLTAEGSFVTFANEKVVQETVKRIP